MTRVNIPLTILRVAGKAARKTTDWKTMPGPQLATSGPTPGGWRKIWTQDGDQED